MLHEISRVERKPSHLVELMTAKIYVLSILLHSKLDYQNILKRKSSYPVTPTERKHKALIIN